VIVAVALFVSLPKYTDIFGENDSRAFVANGIPMALSMVFSINPIAQVIGSVS
jgi:hypothetical protein